MPEIVVVGILFLIYYTAISVPKLFRSAIVCYIVWKTDRDFKEKENAN